MFSNMKKRDKTLALGGAGLLAFLAMYLLLYRLSVSDGTGYVLALLDAPAHPRLLLIAGTAPLFLILLLCILPSYSLGEIKSKDTGDGQHGSARWATPAERRKDYQIVPQGKESVPGIVVGREGKEWLLDTSDKSLLLLAPPGGGKTTRSLAATIVYNALVNHHTRGEGASMIFTDLKGELVQLFGSLLERCSYNICYLNLRDPFHSYHFNLLNNVNRHMDRYSLAETEEERLACYGKAERYAKILAQSIVYSISADSTSDTSAYFNETAQGLLTGIILLVSQYAARQEQRNILSVFSLIIDLNGVVQDGSGASQTNKLQELMGHIDNDRIKSHVGAAMSADFRTSMNIFSSALGKLVGLIDAELEQMISRHSPELSDLDFITRPTAIFLICPDENPTRYFFGSLFLRYFLNDLIAQARESKRGRLSLQVLCLWDEFGNMPAIKDIDVLFSAARSAGIRLIPTLQSLAQLRKNYNDTTAKIIRETCQITMTTYVSPMARETAEEISKALGNRTVQSGSVSKGKGGSQTIQMMGRSLLSVEEIIHIPLGKYIVMKSGCRPIRTALPHYSDYLPPLSEYQLNHSISAEPLDRMSMADVTRLARTQFRLRRGMFEG